MTPRPPLHPRALDGIIASSGHLNALGMRLIALDARGATLALAAGPAHSNAEGGVHGGVLATLLDAACGFAARFDGAERPIVTVLTLSLAVNFVGRAADPRLTARGRVVGGGRRIVFTSGEVVDGEGTVIATANGTFKRLAEAGPEDRSRTE